jgi:hypothetical protein
MSHIVKWMNENKEILNNNFIVDCERFLKKTCLISEIKRQQSNIENIYITQSKQLIKELNNKTSSMDMTNRKRIREIKSEMVVLDKKIRKSEEFIKNLEVKNAEFEENFILDNKISFSIGETEVIYNLNNNNNVFEISEEQLLLLQDDDQII